MKRRKSKLSWKDIDPDFTDELQKSWESHGFSYYQTQKWIEDGGLSIEDFDLAFYLDSIGYPPSEVNKQLEELREEYEEMLGRCGNKPIEKKEITISLNSKRKNREQEKDWKDISPDFTPLLIQSWQRNNFDYEETKEWINIGLGVNKANFCAWLRDIQKIDADWVLNHGNLNELFDEYRQYQELVCQQQLT